MPSLDFEQETSFTNLITKKSLDEIIAPTVTFNPDFNPFDTDKSKSSYSRSDSYAEGFAKKTGGIPSNWDSLYEIVEKEESVQLPLHTGSELETDRPQAIQVEDKTSSKLFFQLHNKYIVSQIHSGFILIDQQAAHERILFEQFLEQLDQHKGLSQQSLFPQTIDLNPADNELMKDLLDDINGLGFQIREFGKNSYIIDGIPADLGTGFDEIKMIEKILEDYKNNQSEYKLAKRENLAKSLARNAAIKPGTQLDNTAMAELVDKLFACQSPNISIYGNPVIVTFTLQELAEKFGKN